MTILVLFSWAAQRRPPLLWSHFFKTGLRRSPTCSTPMTRLMRKRCHPKQRWRWETSVVRRSLLAVRIHLERQRLAFATTRSCSRKSWRKRWTMFATTRNVYFFKSFVIAFYFRLHWKGLVWIFLFICWHKTRNKIAVSPMAIDFGNHHTMNEWVHKYWGSASIILCSCIFEQKKLSAAGGQRPRKYLSCSCI